MQKSLRKMLSYIKKETCSEKKTIILQFFWSLNSKKFYKRAVVHNRRSFDLFYAKVENNKDGRNKKVLYLADSKSQLLRHINLATRNDELIVLSIRNSDKIRVLLCQRSPCSVILYASNLQSRKNWSAEKEYLQRQIP